MKTFLLFVVLTVNLFILLGCGSGGEPPKPTEADHAQVVENDKAVQTAESANK
jgi:hypothetical protein